jgi:hypothetical protein
MTECEEIGIAIAQCTPRVKAYGEALQLARFHMPDESEVVISNVAQAIYEEMNP